MVAMLALLAAGCENLVPADSAFSTTDSSGATDAAGSDAVADAGTDTGGSESDTVGPTDVANSDIAETETADADGADNEVVDVADSADNGDAGDTDIAATDAVGTDAGPIGECQTKAECASKEDGDQCNGTLICDTNLANGTCVLDPSTVKSCEDNNPCTTDSCAKTTGQCSNIAVKDGNACDDGDSCTLTSCQAGVCQETDFLCQCKTTADCASKEDGDLCNGTLYCEPSSKECKVKLVSVVTCGTGSDTPCAKNTCDKATGKCALKPVDGVLIACNDNNPCTTGDTCEVGQCVPGTNTCTCLKDADCANEEDGDICNGTLFCDKSQLPPVCKVNPKTVIKCPNVGDGKCAENECNKTTGACELQSKPDTTACDDGNSCTAPGACVSGACQNEANLCGCKVDADCAAQDDNNLCNGVYYCDKTSGKCLVNPATVVSCATGDDTACKKNQCDPANGQCSLKNVNEGKLCDADGTSCTPVDECVQGQCVQGTNICTCSADADCASKEDGNVCNGTLYCDKTVQPATCKVNPATVKSCPNVDDTTCETNSCDPKTGNCATIQKPDDAKCSDGVDCTIGDVCTSGTCTAGTNVCDCTADDDCPDDNDLCNGVPFCDKSSAPFACKTNPATVVTCVPGGAGCVVTACDKHTGKCGDAPGSCDDSNPCTMDSCNLQNGQCAHANLVDASPCSGGVCVAGSCKTVAESEVAIAAGILQMGCNAAAGCSSDELPVHGVTVDTYAIDRFEVRVKDYEACVTSGNCTAPAGIDADCNWGKAGKETHPVTCVSWPQAQAYCQFASKRLPTEAEWEAAARGLCSLYADCANDTPLYPWGHDTPTCSWTVMMGDSGPGCDLGTTKGVGVMSTDRSPYQLRDMGGNAREWTADWYDASYYAASPGTNPTGPTSGIQRVARGGSWQATTAQIRSTLRHPLLPISATADLGFRCARSLTAP